jgi:hypothetical protein
MKKKQEQGQGIHSSGGSRLRLFSPQSYQKRARREGRDRSNKDNNKPLTEEQRRERGREREEREGVTANKKQCRGKTKKKGRPGLNSRYKKHD